MKTFKLKSRREIQEAFERSISWNRTKKMSRQRRRRINFLRAWNQAQRQPGYRYSLPRADRRLRARIQSRTMPEPKKL